MAIQHLKAISESLTNAQLDYYAQKLIYKEEEAKLLLETNFEEELGKSRPTVAEKDAFVTLKLKPIKEEVDKEVDIMKKKILILFLIIDIKMSIIEEIFIPMKIMLILIL